MNRILAFVAACAAAVLATSALAQVPALEGASAAEKARITALIEAAKGEGAITYWDVVIQPETNDALTAEFRKYYGLPDSFKVNYQLLATAALVTRVEQEIGADKVTVDVAAIRSPSWVFERANKGDAVESTPQYQYYAKAIEATGEGFFAWRRLPVRAVWDSALDFKERRGRT